MNDEVQQSMFPDLVPPAKPFVPTPEEPRPPVVVHQTNKTFTRKAPTILPRQDPRVSPDVQQHEHLARVEGNIAASIIAFWRQSLRDCALFHAEDLRAFVLKNHGTAPASADRILRDLRQKGKINYRVVNRRASQYEAMEL